MLVSEIRKELRKYNHQELENIILELYKKIPKKKKEEYNIDDYIKNVNIKNKEKQIVNLPFIDLKKETIYFLDCVDNGYYSSPNRIISKKERSSYRFKIKKYYKALIDISIDSKDFLEATNLLKVFIEKLKTLDDKLLAIDIINTKVEGFNIKIKAIKDRYSNEKYKLEEIKNCFVKCSLEIYCDIDEATKGIKYFDKYYTGEEKEVKEYILLDMLDRLALKEEWIKEYESKMNKIDFRESLRERYNSLKLEK